jgi:ATP-dependent helicase Lhr and Lhr-like helicase
MLVSRHLDHRAFFANLRTVIVDELHAFAGDDRGWHLLAVLARIAHLAWRMLQRIGLSATIGNAQELLDWLYTDGTASRHVINLPVERGMEADVELDSVGSLPNAALVMSRLHRGEKRLVFCDSRARVEELVVELRQRGVETFVSHISLAHDERRRAETAFADEEAFLRAAALLHLWKQGYVEPVMPPPLPYAVPSGRGGARGGLKWRSTHRNGLRRSCMRPALNTSGWKASRAP